MAVVEVLRSEFPNYQEIAELPFDQAGIDSFALVELRAAVESASGAAISDRTWTGLRRLSDIAALAGGFAQEPENETFVRRRDHTINMPQMATGGLSESWLFKELGDLHWSMITEGLRTPSAQIVDGNGERLYATFTRIRLETEPLRRFGENDPLSIEGGMSRYGGGIFTSQIKGASSNSKTISAQTMSSFAKRGEHSSNRGLLKGQPVVPENCPISALAEKPDFAGEYGKVRRELPTGTPLFECEYEVNPYHDINGVGLVYFAAYPIIADTCALGFFGRPQAMQTSTVMRDVFYFSNADANDTLVYRLLRAFEPDGGGMETEALISNRDGMVPMALVRTRKA